ncbi:MAG: MSEP-CTERM sorting domain-containing protein [Verrucomicrobia bacterium]|nr:MSEP-CTERM sorting domain-containing protein [Verrucomicrobiota bacterium]MDA1085422.1 MSEP-CTERM sorting domain-containing protein [Verrucomicrobiota bacterium]
MNNSHKPFELLPEAVRKPVYILWLFALPQLLLLALNVRAYLLVQGEMDSTQRVHATIIGLIELALLCYGIGLWVFLRRRGRIFSWLPAIPTLLLHIGYLWMLTTWGMSIIPRAASTWMLPETELLFNQFALIMPAVFYAGVCLIAFRLPFGRGVDAGVSLVALVGIPAGWYLLFAVVQTFSPWQLPELIMVFGFVGSTVIMLLAFVRVLLNLYSWLHDIRRVRFVLPLIAGVAAPIGGLLLNRAIPFPFDFQDPKVYIFTILNGLVLLLPFPAGRAPRLLMWTVRVVLLPFTLYFFIVFLPFLPLSIVAMIAAGAGFLILAPTLLFVVHTRQLHEEYKLLAPQVGRWTLLGAFVIGISVLPASYSALAIAHRHALMQAVDLTYSPDFSEARPTINRKFARAALMRLRRMKDGIYLPFLSEYYNQLVFEGMVLSDQKMDTVYELLFGAEPDWEDARRSGIGAEFMPRSGSRRRSAGWRDGGGAQRPSRNVTLSDLSLTEQHEGNMIRATLTLTMQNEASAQAEFRTPIELPDGVLVSGYWLDVEGTRVPGRIFEKKTAAWVYHMIRDTERRDPGLLVYDTYRRLTLSVFPFAAGQQRVTQIEFLYPDCITPVFDIGDRRVSGVRPAPDPRGLVRVDTGADQDWLIIPRNAAQALPTTRRTPYLHFIVDASATGSSGWAQMADRILGVLDANPDIQHCRISAANYAHAELTTRRIDRSGVKGALRSRAATQMRFEGAFCPERAIKATLLGDREQHRASGPRRPGVPVFVALHGENTRPLIVDGLYAFAHLTPDAPHYYIQAAEGQMTQVPFDGGAGRVVGRIPAPAPVFEFRTPGRNAVCRAEDVAMVAVLPADLAALEIFDPASGEFRPVDARTIIAPDAPYAKGASAWQQLYATAHHPATLNRERPAIVEQSRASGIMVPLTSYIVVENSAQWAMLKRKENQSLGAHAQLDFDDFVESPVPPSWLLAPVVFLLMRRRLKKKPALNQRRRALAGI